MITDTKEAKNQHYSGLTAKSDNKIKEFGTLYKKREQEKYGKWNKWPPVLQTVKTKGSGKNDGCLQWRLSNSNWKFVFTSGGENAILFLKELFPSSFPATKTKMNIIVHSFK